MRLSPIFSSLIPAAALLLTGCAALPVSPAGGPMADATPAISRATFTDVVTRLASDEFEGRKPGTPGEDKTVALLTERFRQAGLQPGNRGRWTQEVPLVAITAVDHSPLVVRGRGGAVTMRHGADFVGGTARQVPGIDLKNAELVFVGHGINAPEKGWNDYAGVDMRGKIAVILINDPDWSNAGPDGPFGGRAMTYYGRWTYKFEEAARQGAAGAIIIHQTEPAAYGWNVVQTSWSGPQNHPATSDNGMSSLPFAGWMQLARAEEILRLGGTDLASLTTDARQRGFRARPLGLTADLSFANRISRSTSRNVLGMVRGTERPDEYVLYTAHWDHLGRCDARDGDDICNGAVDNASGTAALVALGEAFAKVPPRRSVLFVAVTAEESGLLGSTYYAANPAVPIGQTVGGINMDALAPAGPQRDMVVIGGAKSDLDRMLLPIVAKAGRRLSPDPATEKGFYYRSDHFPLAAKGIPMLYAKGGPDLVDGGVAAGEAYAANYTERHYHAPSDDVGLLTPTAISGMLGDIAIYHQLGLALADGSDWPNWNDGDEFRAARDAVRLPRR